MKTAFIALNYHLQNSKASNFLIDIVRSYSKEFFLVNANNAWHDIPKIKPDTIIIFQQIYTPQEIDSFGAQNIILVPMHDACPHTQSFWNQYKNYKVLCFSKALYNLVHDLGIESFYIQFYKKPIFETLPVDKLSNRNAFYWERSKKITWKTIKYILGDNRCSALHYHYATNIVSKNNDRPTSEENLKYSISYSDWFETPEEYTQLVKNTDLFFAPRESEGIGMSFIEALSYGCCIIAYDDATMNEYITSGVDGFLYKIAEDGTVNFKLPFPLEDNELLCIRNAALKRAQNGYNKWISDIPNMMKFINNFPVAYTPRKHIFLYAYKRLRIETKLLLKKIKIIK